MRLCLSYDGRFVDGSLYERESLDVVEGKRKFKAVWRSLEELRFGLHPIGFRRSFGSCWMSQGLNRNPFPVNPFAGPEGYLITSQNRPQGVATIGALGASGNSSATASVTKWRATPQSFRWPSVRPISPTSWAESPKEQNQTSQDEGRQLFFELYLREIGNSVIQLAEAGTIEQNHKVHRRQTGPHYATAESGWDSWHSCPETPETP